MKINVVDRIGDDFTPLSDTLMIVKHCAETCRTPLIRMMDKGVYTGVETKSLKGFYMNLLDKYSELANADKLSSEVAEAVMSLLVSLGQCVDVWSKDADDDKYGYVVKITTKGGKKRDEDDAKN